MGAANATTISSSGSKKEQMKQIETDLSREKEQFQKYHLKEKGLLEQLSNIEKLVAEKGDLLRVLRKKIDLNRKELKKRQKVLEVHEGSLEEVEKRLGKRLVALYKYAKRGYLGVLIASNDLDQLRRRMKYLGVIADEDKRILRQLANERQRYMKALSLIQG